MSRIAILAAMFLVVASAAWAKIQSEEIDYKQGDTVLKGHLFYDDAATGKRPGILVVHEWWGVNDYAQKRAAMLAEAGYVTFALDMYGEGKTTSHPEEAGEWAGAVAANKETARARFLAARDILAANEHVDASRIGAIGYCFGGGVVLNMAISGVDIAGVVSFHGGLPADPASGKVKAKILVCHGAADGFVSDELIATFKKNMEEAGADWEMNIYGGAKHSFTNPAAGEHGIPALAYNEEADKRSWRAMMAFFKEIFG